ncbi:MAG: peptidoglycan-binding protein [Nitrospira sp.]
MPLTSPRFTSSHTLNRVAANATKLDIGSTGRAVHLVQMALIDIGYAFPLSTGNPNYSPDGIYGDETASVVKHFQKHSRPLAQDGVVGRHTMEELDRRFVAPQHQVRLHFRSLALANVSFDRSLRNAVTVFGQYGIKVVFASGESLRLTPAQTKVFEKIDSGFSSDGQTGCGGHAIDRPACTVAAHAFGWTTAHEVCHVLLGSSFSPVHVEDTRNLMFRYSRRESSVPVLTDRQVAQIRRSVCCSRI